VIAREGYSIIAIVVALAIALVVLTSEMNLVWRAPLLALAAGSVGFVLLFFRDPDRTPPPEAASGLTVLAPADGKVVEIARNEHEPTYIDGPATRVSIFLSPLNVHVNRVPVDGVVERVRYVPGDYLVAWHPKASDKNERSEIGVRHRSGTRVLFKQIAGAVARRIVFHLKEGNTVRAGDRFGIVKFGSRMDVLVPEGVVIRAEKGQRVRAGKTIIGQLPAADGTPGAAADPSRSSAAETAAQ
jgi:phosphatidylserine decarboxylase